MEGIMVRHPANPVLSADRIPYPATLIFNAGVAKYQGRYVMVFRNDYGGQPGTTGFKGTNIGVAYSSDGIVWEPRSKPWIEWKTEEIRRAYDPRITVIDNRCYLCFAVDTRHGIRGGIAVSDDLDRWEVLSLSAPDNRNMVLFPEKVNGKFLRLERPFPVYGRGGPENFDLWYSDSPDGVYWGNTNLVLGSELVPWANAKVGPGAPPVKTRAGWQAAIVARSRRPNGQGWSSAFRRQLQRALASGLLFARAPGAEASRQLPRKRGTLTGDDVSVGATHRTPHVRNIG